MVWAYGKGARNERELINLFVEKDFMVIRAAGSGVNSLSPDLLVFRKGAQYAFECKAWDSEHLRIEKGKMQGLRRWEEVSGITTMIAWKIPRKSWYFMYLRELEEQEKNCTISRKKVELIGRKLEDLFL